MDWIGQVYSQRERGVRIRVELGEEAERCQLKYQCSNQKFCRINLFASDT